jgi:hypothetical protein
MEGAAKVPGRKRGLAVDVLGLVIAVVVLAASAHENAAGTALLDKVAATAPAVSTALVDQGFKNSPRAPGCPGDRACRWRAGVVVRACAVRCS